MPRTQYETEIDGATVTVHSGLLEAIEDFNVAVRNGALQVRLIGRRGEFRAWVVRSYVRKP